MSSIPQVSLVISENGPSRQSIGEFYMPSTKGIRYGILEQQSNAVVMQHEVRTQDVHTEVDANVRRTNAIDIEGLPNQLPMVSETLPQESTRPIPPAKRNLRAPVMMISSLSLGLGLALEHHFMNTALDGTQVTPDGPLSQQWTARYGIALGFLVKLLFVSSISTAFVQRQWLNILRYQQRIYAKEAETLSSGLFDIFSMFEGRVWSRFPLLWLMALAAWTIPFAAIIAPAALSIEIRPFVSMWSYSVPRLSFDSSNELYYITNSENTALIESQQLSKASFATTVGASILEVTPRFSNQTYSLTFFGPALACETVNTAPFQDILRGPFMEEEFTFIAWTGNLTAVQNQAWEDYSFAPIDNADLTINSSIPIGNTLSIASALGSQRFGDVFNLTTCQLYNASYDIKFEFQNYRQTVILNSLTYINRVWYLSIDPDQHFVLCWKGIMAALGSLLVGTNGYDLKSSFYYMLKVDFSTAETTARGVEELFRNITLSLFSLSNFLDPVAKPTDVSVTTLANTYVYKRYDLVFSYSISFLISLICCVIGMHSFLVNKSGYRNTFSVYISAVEKKMLKSEETVTDS